jgi:hypothetical protein
MHADFNVHARGVKRRTEFLKESCTFLENDDQLREVVEGGTTEEKRFILRYLTNPIELIGKERIGGVKVERMRLEGVAGR